MAPAMCRRGVSARRCKTRLPRAALAGFGCRRKRARVVDIGVSATEARQTVDGSGGVASYEFGPLEEAKIAKLAWRARLWGIVALTLSVLGIGAFVLVWIFVVGGGAMHGGLVIASFVAAAPVLVVNALIAFLYIGAGKSLRAVVETRREDVPHLLAALARLSGAFRIETVLGSIGLVAGAIGLYSTLGGGG